MALVGLIRVSTDAQNTDRQRDALAPICVKVFEEKVSGKLAVAERPALSAALAYLRTGDMLTVLEVDRLGRDTLTGLVTLAELFSKGVHVRVLSGIGAGNHTQMSLILELAIVLATERRRDIVSKTNSGLAAARSRGRVGGRRPVMTEALVTQAVALRDKGFTIRQIQPHLYITEGKSKGKNPSVGAISQALATHDASNNADELMNIAAALVNVNEDAPVVAEEVIPVAPLPAKAANVSRTLKAAGFRPKNGERLNSASGYRASQDGDRVAVTYRGGTDTDDMGEAEVNTMRADMAYAMLDALTAKGYPVEMSGNTLHVSGKGKGKNG